MKRLFVIVAAVLSLSGARIGAQEPVSAEQSIGALPYVVLSIGSSLDAASTIHALKTVPGAREANPVLSHGGTPGFVVTKTALTAFVAWQMRWIAKKGHPRAAKIIGYAAGAGLSGVAYRNARVGRR